MMYYIVTCPRCGYRWVYQGRSGYARCPKCNAHFRVKRHGFAVSRSKLRAIITGDNTPTPEDELQLYRNALAAVMRAVGFVRVSEVAKVVSRDAVEDLLQTARNSPELVVIHADGDAAIIHRDVLWSVYVALKAAPVAERWWSRLSRVEREVVRFLREARLIWFDRSSMRWRLSNLIQVMATPTQQNRSTV